MAGTLLILSLALNIVVLIPVLIALVRDGQAAQVGWGPDSAARRILGCIYAAILLASCGLLAGQLLGWGITSAALSLLAVQVIYKLLTALAVGLKNQVVLSNLAIALVHAITIWAHV